MKKTLLLAALATFGLTDSAWAGAGAIVYACVAYSSKPALSTTVTATPSDPTQCMNSDGSSTTFNVTEAGVTCGKIGYVEENGSCNTSTWNLAYTAKTSSTSGGGSTKSDWKKDILFGSKGHIVLESYSPGTVVCPSQDLCASIEFDWENGTQPDVYFIFQPDAN